MKLSNFADTLISTFVIFITSVALLNYFNLQFYPRILISLTISSLFAFYMLKKSRTIYQKYILNKKEQELFDSILYQMKINDYLTNQKIIKKTFLSNNIEINCVKNNIFYKQYCIFNLFSFEEISTKNIIKCYKKTPKNKKTLIFCSNLSTEAIEFIKDFSMRIKILDFKELFLLMKKVSIFPPVNDRIKEKKKNYKLILKQIFSKKYSGKFFYSGITMLIFSFFVFFPVYYLVIGTILCILGLVCRFYGKLEGKSEPFFN